MGVIKSGKTLVLRQTAALPSYLAYNTVNIDEFKKKYNTIVTNDSIKINDWTERMPGITEYTFNNQIKLTLGISPNDKNIVYMPQLFSDIVDISKIDNLSEILYGILKVEDDTITSEQADIIASKISLDEIEIMMIDSPYGAITKKETINSITVDACYYDNELCIRFYDVYLNS